MKLFATIHKALFTVSVVFLSGIVHAQGYPSKPIQFVVAFPPGGGTDYATRLVANAMSPRIGQPVVVTNKVGAGGAIATAAVAKATADGYTVLVCANPSITMSPHLMNLPYDPAKDLIPLVKLLNVWFVSKNCGRVWARVVFQVHDIAPVLSP